jgi:hypothetical protein
MRFTLCGRELPPSESRRWHNPLHGRESRYWVCPSRTKTNELFAKEPPRLGVGETSRLTVVTMENDAMRGVMEGASVRARWVSFPRLRRRKLATRVGGRYETIKGSQGRKRVEWVKGSIRHAHQSEGEVRQSQ